MRRPSISREIIIPASLRVAGLEEIERRETDVSVFSEREDWGGDGEFDEALTERSSADSRAED